MVQEASDLKLLRTFTISDAVEGAVEVRLELAEALRSYRSRSRVLLGGLALGVVLLMGAIIAEDYWFVLETVDILRGDAPLDLTYVGLALVYLFVTVMVLALGGAILIFVIQMGRFFAILRARYGTLEGPGMGSTPAPGRPRKDKGTLEEDEALPDPARMLLGLAKEAEEEASQLDNLWRASTAFTMMLAFISLVTASMAALGYAFAPSSWTISLTAVNVLALLTLSLSVALLVEAGRFVRYFIARINALEAFEAEGAVPVPPGDTALDRLQYCLVSKGNVEAEVVGPSELKGASGSLHAFDRVLGEEGDRVLVRTYEGSPGIDQLRDLRGAAEDVARREGEMPLGIIALVTEGMEDLDVDDVVYDYLMEQPLLDEEGDRARSLQIVAEVEGYYSVLPFTVP